MFRKTSLMQGVHVGALNLIRIVGTTLENPTRKELGWSCFRSLFSDLLQSSLILGVQRSACTYNFT